MPLWDQRTKQKLLHGLDLNFALDYMVIARLATQLCTLHYKDKGRRNSGEIRYFLAKGAPDTFPFILLVLFDTGLATLFPCSVAEKEVLSLKTNLEALDPNPECVIISFLRGEGNAFCTSSGVLIFLILSRTKKLRLTINYVIPFVLPLSGKQIRV